MDEDEIKDLIWDFCMLAALKNAYQFGGTPNPGAVKGKVMKEFPELRKLANQVDPFIKEVCEEVSKMNLDEQKQLLLEIDPKALEGEKPTVEFKELPELPNLDKYEKVVMRLAPYPSGALHVGNARMIILNDEYAKKYNGELILFFDDTIGSPKALRDTSKAKYVLPEAYGMIEEGLKWLGVKYSQVYYKSDRLEIFYEYCEKLINEGMAYVCFCDAGVFKNEYKNHSKSCPHRDLSVEENLKEWKNILAGKYEEMSVVVRLKTGMDQKDPALRDQIIMRISEATHPRVGNKYQVWPMLEFSWAIDDHLIGVSHIVRGADLVKEDFIEDFVWDHFKWKKAEFTHYGRLRFPDIKLSKTEARNNIQAGTYDGWNDPRTWSLQSLQKRGIKPEALREYLLDLGLSMSGINFDVKKLYAKNQDIIDPIADRYFYVEDPVAVTIEGLPKAFEAYAEPLLLPSNVKKGKRIIKVKADNHNKLHIFVALKDAQKMKAGQVVRLKDLLNIQLLSINLKKKQILACHHSIELSRDYKIIHWVPKEDHIKVSIMKVDGTISKGFGESNLLKIKLNKVIQFERYGFVNPLKLENNELYCYFTH
ncbi:MAG: glutamate--tRNA ligase [Candidatus Lokiarchaeota archaeon]|nr:glutamate--tRNA ligase [Candidatus Lokiarchaeota archaeon]